MKIVYISYYFPPDLGAGSFRSKALIENLKKKINKGDELHIITSEPNRYTLVSKNFSFNEKNIFIHRSKVPNHNEKFILKTLAGIMYFVKSVYKILRIKPHFIISSSARLVSGCVAFLAAKILRINYVLDIRDLFSSFVKSYFKKNKILFFFIKIFFYIEKTVIINALSVNFVSPGFYNYYKKNKVFVKNKTFFTNGVDKIFYNKKKIKKNKKKNAKKNILYAGNIGIGQNIENLIPQVAKLNKDILFLIIGDGGKLEVLKDKNKFYKNKNIKILKPINRNKLIEYYNNADILFLNLNNLETFKYNLPSKIYEYSVFNKPILAGLNGFSKIYCKKNFKNFYFFKPSNVKECNSKLNEIINSKKILKNKIKFDRDEIMSNYSKYILKNININHFNSKR